MATEEKKNGTNGEQKGTTPVPTRQESHLAMMKRTVVDVVAAKARQYIESGELVLPKDYAVDNALKAAWLILQNVEDMNHNKALSVCTTDSIANSLLDMIVQGLNPIKKQCAFVVYGKTLICQREYFGSMVVAKTVEPRVYAFAYEAVYKGDKLKYSIINGKKTVTEHEQDIENVDKTEIIAAYAMALDKEGNPFRTDVMTIEEIKQAWRQSKTKPIDENGNIKPESTHGKFTADMAKKTVVNRLCKAIINASSDNALLLDRIIRNDDLADRAAVESEIDDKANTGDVIDIETVKAEIEQLPPEPEAPPLQAAGQGNDMARTKQYCPGEILSAREIVDNLTDGGSVFWNHRLMHKSFLSGMQFRTVLQAAREGIIRRAIRNKEGDA